MEKLDAQIKNNQSIQKDLYGDFSYCDVQGDFTLPDYLPEVRKIVRIDASVIPSGKFISSSKAELGGIVAYNLIYSDAEGKLAATQLSSNYEFSVPLPSEHGELYVISDSTAESVQCRLSAPRKLSLRTSVKSKVHIYSSSPIDEIVDEELSDLQTLECRCDTMMTKCANSGEFSLSEVIEIDSFAPDMLRTNFANADLVVRDARITQGGVACRGEIIVKCNISVQEGDPFTVMRKIPFEELVEMDAQNAESCIAYGRCNFVHCSVMPNGEYSALGVEIGAELDVECMSNTSLSLMQDAYSTEYEALPTYKTEVLPYFLGSIMGNYTLDASRKRTDEEQNLVAIIDTKCKAEVNNISEKDGKAVVFGECTLWALTSSVKPDGEGIEYGNSEIVFPFKLETELRVKTDGPIDYDCHVDCTMARARIEQDAISADAELFLTLKASKKAEHRLLDSISFDTESKKATSVGEIVVTYPDDGDTLFSVAKKYRAPYRTLAELNGIPAELAEHPDEQITLDGVSHLIIP